MNIVNFNTIATHVCAATILYTFRYLYTYLMHMFKMLEGCKS